MKKKSLLMMLLVALFVPLAMNAQTRMHNNILGSTKNGMTTQNQTFVKSPVQIPNLESRNFNLGNPNNAMGSRITRDGAEYELVTTSQSDWSGNYVMAVPFSETVGYGFDGTIDDNTGGIAQVTLENYTSMTSIGDAAVLTIAPSSADASYYTIKINGGDYLADGTSGLETSSTETNYTNWDISLTSDGMQLYNPVWSGGPYYLYFLYFENTTSGSAGAFFLTDDGTSYTSETVEGYEFEYIFPYLYKEVSSGGGYTDCDYEKVTASQSDWSGDYVITYVNGTTAYVLTGQSGSNNYGAYTTATVTNNLLANADVAAYNVTIEPVTYNNQTKYTLKLGNNYLGYTSTSTSGNNYLYFATSIPTSNPQRYYWTIAYSNNTVTLTSVYNTRRVLKWNSSQPRFACYTSGQNAITLFKKLTECEPPCATPTNLTASNVTTTTAHLGWNGEANGYNVRYRTAGYEETIFSDDFENGLGNWTIYTDADDLSDYGIEDGWFAYTASSLSQTAHGGTVCAFSCSWMSDALTADNWLITPQVALKGTLKFYVRSNYSDQYEVKLSTTDNAESSFTVTLKTLAAAPSSWSLVSLDLSSYNGQPGYIAIHHNFTDGQWLCVDDFGIYETVEPGPWMPNENGQSASTNSLDLTGLDSETLYEWQVMAECEDGDSDWSTSNTFTTLSTCDTPTGLSSADVTNATATLSWTGMADTYDIQYREYDATEPATIILTAANVWGDGSGYQMLLDADATAYDDYEANGVSAITDYSMYEYKIPANADYDMNTSNMVVDGSVSIEIPAGTYDYFIFNPTPNDNVYIAGESGNVGGRKDNYVFGAGKTYEFVVSRYGGGDGVDVTITADWTVVEGETSPYQVTGLNPSTTYEWQVQGADCDNWSAEAYFTTLDGTLVESITASDVTVLVGETATITPTVLPADATNPAVNYTSADETIATVNASGVVTGVAPGNTTITIAAADASGVSTTINVTVNGIDVETITASDVTVVNGETATIVYTVLPANATDQSVTFTVEDQTIATVDADGVVTGVGVGTTTITIASVSNPEVTATVNVTVTSDPNAVQFTVNAPANAHPGDVITVEAVLAAPTSGNYDGFNALLSGIYYDNTAFELVDNSIVNGPVAQAATQNGNQAVIMTGTDVPGVVQLTIACWQGYVTTEGVVFSAQFTVLAGAEGNFEFSAKPVSDTEFTYEGALIPYEFTSSTVNITTPEVYTKDILGRVNGGGWYMISSPVVEDITPTEDNGFITDNGTAPLTYDLYRYNQSAPYQEWENYRVHNFAIENGKGYLYSNQYNDTLVFMGTSRTETEVSKDLDYDADAILPGWNLVGNPFAVPAYITGSYYVLDGAAVNTYPSSGDAINPMEAVFVEATEEGQSVTFTTARPAMKASTLSLNLTQGNGLVDRAIVRFDESTTLSKFQIFETSKIYIPMEGKDYAVVCSEGMGELPVNFKAVENGTYTLGFSNQEVEFGYLHLIDNMTGKDIDLLQSQTYTFSARTTDYESRFKLVFATGDNTNDDNFAFFSNGNFVINNEGAATLQVIDVNGRIVKSESINGCADVNVNAAAGVYMLRLINGNNVKVQKVVVK